MEAPSWKDQGYFPKRYAVAVMAFLGMVFNYMLRVNINLTIVAMVKADNSSNSSEAADVCGFEADSEASESFEGEFDWNEWTQSLITGAFFWGYIWTQIPGGRLAEVFGARRVFGGALLLASIVTFFIPLAAKSGSNTLIAIRVILGLSEGATFPSTHALLATWAPPLERSKMSTIIYAGSQAGTIIAFPLAAAIIDSLGWEAVFYIQAAMTLVWCLAWFLVVSDNPGTDKHITEVEREYIYAAIGDSKERKAPPVPWRQALTSLPFWAILIAGVGNNWGFYTLLTDLPLYMKNMLQQDIKSNAVLSGMPYLGMWIFSLIISYVGDRLRQGTLSTQAVRKIANTIAHVGPALCLLSLAFVECNRGATIAILFSAVTLQGGIYTGFMVNHVDIAPNFAGTLFGITNAAATIPGWVAPMTVGALTNGQQTFGQWRKVFYISAAWFIADAIFFVLFASGTIQHWNKVQETPTTVVVLPKKKAKVEEEYVPGDDPPYDVYVVNANFRNSYVNQAFKKD